MIFSYSINKILISILISTLKLIYSYELLKVFNKDLYLVYNSVNGSIGSNGSIGLGKLEDALKIKREFSENKENFVTMILTNYTNGSSNGISSNEINREKGGFSLRGNKLLGSSNKNCLVKSKMNKLEIKKCSSNDNIINEKKSNLNEFGDSIYWEIALNENGSYSLSSYELDKCINIINDNPDKIVDNKLIVGNKLIVDKCGLETAQFDIITRNKKSKIGVLTLDQDSSLNNSGNQVVYKNEKINGILSVPDEEKVDLLNKGLLNQSAEELSYVSYRDIL